MEESRAAPAPAGRATAPRPGPGSTIERLRASAPAADLAGSVRQFLRTQIVGGRPDVRLTAEARGPSTRTLQRRLREDAVDYSTLLEHARFDLGLELLREPKQQIIGLAHELGHGDSANFMRACRHASFAGSTDDHTDDNETARSGTLQ